MRVGLLLLPFLLILPSVAADHVPIDRDPAADLFPTASEIQAAIDAIKGHPWATVHVIGESGKGVPLYAVEITDPDSQVPMEDRVVTYLMTQQHGNEPAGTPAALRLLEEIGDYGEATKYLSNQILILTPQINPDGAAVNDRENADNVDINRDHVLLSTPEATAIHKVLQMWDVHMAMDHHEYGGSAAFGLGHPSPVNIYDFDITTMYPNHGNVRAPTRGMSEELNYQHLKPWLEERGYTHGDYGTITVTAGDVSVPVRQLAGGPDPGILRNNYGLNNVVGLLIESYVAPDENPVYSFERRVGAQKAVMDAVLAFGTQNAERLIEAKRESERLNREQPFTHYQEGEPAGAMPEAFHFKQDLSTLFAGHGLPQPVAMHGGHVHNAVHGRMGLVAAMLHPDSSRQVTDARSHDVVELPADVAAHPDYAGFGAESLQGGVDDEAAPGPGMLVVAALAAIALTRRR